MTPERISRLHPSRRTGVRRRGGFTLLEVLIAVVVLSIGLLGVAAMQTIGLRGSHGAYLSSQAAILAYDIADRIRANEADVSAYLGGMPENRFESACPEALPASPLAAVDFAAWSCALEDLLPFGAGEISEDPVLEDQYLIRVTWADMQAEIEDEERVPWNFELTIQL